jgi:chromosome partitioning protein
MTVKVTIANQKGGVAKTTTVITLAHGLALKNYTVMVVDLDPQGQCASLLGMQQEPGIFNLLVNRPPLRDVVRTTGRPNLYLLPGDKRTAAAQTLLTVENYKVSALQTLLDDHYHEINSGIHFVIIDTAPAVGGLQENAIYAADVLLIPAAVDYLALEGVIEIFNTLDVVRPSGPPIIRVIPTFYDSRTKESQINLSKLRELEFSGTTMEPIHRATILRECAALGKTIFEHDPSHRAAEEYAKVVWEVVNATRQEG